jgi:iron complex outermembrane receptor protein
MLSAMTGSAVRHDRNAQLDLSTYDLDRVEVLRGPQGTLYGEGSAGGTIHFITKNPVLDRFGMDADVAALFTQDGAPGQRVETVVNVPLIDNVLGIRIAGVFDHEGGWIDQPAADRKNFNEEDKTDVRAKALWQPTAQWSVNAMADIHRNDASSNSGEDANGNYTQAFGLTTTPRLEDRFDIYNLTSSYDFDVARLLSSTSYVKQDKIMTNYGYALPIEQPPAPAFEVDLIPFSNDARILTEELRLASDGSGPWQWTAGGFYRRFQFEQSQTYLFGLPGPPPAQSFSSATSSLSKSWAAFGDTSYRLADRLTLGAGLRYFHDSQDFSNGSSLQSTDFHSLNPRAYIQYKISDDLNVYTSAAKGFRSGGFNNAQGEPSYGPESVWTEELGTKMSLFEGHLSADVAIFYSDYTNYQITGVSPQGPPGLPITSNGGNARVKGVEWDLSWQPLVDWTLSANGDYVDSYFYKVGVTSPDHAVGDPLDFVPKYALTFSAQRDFRLVGRSAFARLDFNEQGRQTFRLRNVAGPTPWFFSESDVIHMLNFNSRLQWNDNLSLGVFAQNLLNNRGLIDPFAIESTATRSRPRTLGVQFSVKFD